MNVLDVKLSALHSTQPFTDDKVGKELWFEYHCLESLDSADAVVWLHSHQKVMCLYIVELGMGEIAKERAEEGTHRVYKVRFSDGLEYDVFEDELLTGPDQFCRPDSPTKNLY